MNALTAVQNNAVDSGQDYSGFTLIPVGAIPASAGTHLHRTDDQTVSRTGCRMARAGAGVQIVSAFSGRQNS